MQVRGTLLFQASSSCSSKKKDKQRKKPQRPMWKEGLSARICTSVFLKPVTLQTNIFQHPRYQLPSNLIRKGMHTKKKNNQLARFSSNRSNLSCIAVILSCEAWLTEQRKYYATHIKMGSGISKAWFLFF